MTRMASKRSHSRPRAGSVWLAALAAFLLLVGEHYVLAGLEVPFTYVAGVLALHGPFSAWCVFYRMWWPLATLWSVTVAGGAAVVGAYTLDWALARDPGWLTGAGLLVMTLCAALVLALSATWWLYRQVRVLRAELALRGGMGDGVGERTR